jgi:hypothetical protein
MLSAPTGAGERYAMGFMRYTLADGQVFCTLNVVNDYTRECLAIEVDTMLAGRAGGEGVGEAPGRGKMAPTHCGGQRAGVREQGGGSVGGAPRRHPPLHRPGQADAERLRRELQGESSATSA